MSSNPLSQHPTVHPPLPKPASAPPPQRLKICIASYDFVGPVRNGGVGTAFTSLGETLARAGHDVTFFYLSGTFCENLNLNHWISVYQKKGIRFVPMPEQTGLKLAASFHMAKSYEAYQWLCQTQFDIIHFSEWRAPGYYSLVAKKQGLAFQNTTLCIHTHGPTLWSLLSNGEYLTQVSDVELDFMERQSVQLADVVVSPSHYLARWMQEQHWELPDQTFVQQYVQPANARKASLSGPPTVRPVRELVFFGRVEVRKGLVLFCDALDRLAKEPDAKNLKITFLGKLTKVNETEGLDFLKKRAGKWPWKWESVSNLDQLGALTYLQGEGRLALIPSLADNLPNTVLECLGGKVPFLASDIGGIPEMILPEDRAGILFPLRAQTFAAKILHAVRHGVAPARFAVEPEATERAWLDWHNGLGSAGLNLLSQDSLLDTPRVSVCMSHFNRPEYLRQALDSLRAQDYPNFEVVLVDDASTKPEAIAYINSLEAEFAQRGWQLIRNPEELFVGAARNLAARRARGEYLMFMDDDNIAKPNEISVFVNVARKTNADTVSCCLDFFSTTEPPTPNRLPDQRFLFLGSAVSASALRNYLGDTNSFFRREVFLKLGGFHEERGVGHEDWELLADAIFKGYRHEVVPDALVWYRRLDDGNNATITNSLQRGHMRNIRPYLDAVPPSLRTLVLFAQGQVVETQNGCLSGNAARQIAYLKLSLRWRVPYETARELFVLRQRQPAAKQLKLALTAATETKNPYIVLEAMLAVGAEMHANNDPDARQVLQLAVQLANDLKRTADVERAQSLLNAPAGKSRIVSPAPAKQNHCKTVPAKNAAPPAPAPQSSGVPIVSIIIPVFNNLALTKDCLDSINTNPDAVPHEIIVVDNASTDGTKEFLNGLEKAGQVRVLTNSQNEGFARACNQGAQVARGSLLLFLNNDTRVTSGWLDAMVKAAHRHQVGIIGAKLLYADNRIQHAGIGFVNGLPDHPNRYAPADAPQVNQFRELDMVTAACLMSQRELFLKLGGFDEIYRNGVEDIDLCVRVRAAGWKVVYEPKAVVYHPEGQSVGRFNHVTENLRIFFERWGKSFDSQKRFIVPKPAKIMLAARSLLREEIRGVQNARREHGPDANRSADSLVRESPKTASRGQGSPRSERSNDRTVSVDWIGSFLDHGSLSQVNREMTAALKFSPAIHLRRVANGAPTSPGFENLAREISASPSPDAAVTVRHAWPPNWKRPAKGKLAIIQPWEFGSLPQDWVNRAREVDEFWVPSNYVRNGYLESGVPAEKVFVVPNGVDPEKFHPQAVPMKLATQKKFKFLFVGGTIGRKGPDLLLQAYLQHFTAADDVCLVIKDFGGKHFYAGQTFETQICAAQAQPNAPEILYLNQELSPDTLPGLYTACDCLVLPYRGEGFGLPVLEAMACGLPVIVTAGGATDDFVRDEFAWRIPAAKKIFGHEIGGLKLAGPGWLLEPDIAALGRFLRDTFANPAEARRRGQLAAQNAKQFSWQNAAVIAAKRVQELCRQIGGASLPVGLDARQRVASAEKASSATKGKIILPPCALVGHLAEARDLVRQKKFCAAWEATLSALAKRPFHPGAFLLLGEIARIVGDGPSARFCAQHARRMAPGWKPAKKFLNQRLKGGAKPEWLKLPEEVQSSKFKVSSLSVCLIVKNEEKFLGRCLASVRDVATQIVIVDTGSTDRTVAIAKEYGAEVHSFAWCDDFSAARNAALEYATGHWVLMLDADEELSAEGREKLKAAMSDPAVMAWRLPMVDAGCEADGVSYVPRFYRNAPGLFYVGRVHEQVFSSIEVRRGEWGLENRLGDVMLIHHGYTAEVMRDRKKIERNLQLLERAVAELPDEPHLLMNLGLELARSGRDAEALDRYREAFNSLSSKSTAEIVPELRETLLRQYCARLAAAKQFVEIVGALTSPLAKMNGGLTASLHFSLGLAQIELKQFGEAADQMRQCLAKRNQRSLMPAHGEIRTAAPFHCLALALAKSGETADAEKAFQNGLKEHGRADELRLDYAKFLAGQNRSVDALHQLHEIVQGSAQHAGAWRLGGDVALSRPEFLEFARDWTAEAIRQLPEDALIIAQRAEALLLSQQATEALPLWMLAVNGERPPRALAAQILCATMAAQPAERIQSSSEEAAVSRAFVDWYRRLVNTGARDTIVALNSRVETLRPILPSAAGVLDGVIAATQGERTSTCGG